jgi:hypothetical protein
MDNNKFNLDDLPKKLPFNVPDGYFDKLPSTIQARIPVGVEKKPFFLFGWQRSLVATTAMSLLAFLVWITYPETQGSLGKSPLSGVSDDAIIAYLDQQDVSYYDLSDHKEVQGAFATDSTVMYYLDGVDIDFIEQQIDDSGFLMETI